MQTLCEILSHSIPEIVSRWEQTVDREPWSRLSRSERIDELPDFLTQLFDVTICRAGSAADPRPLLDTATRHGEQRRRLGLDYDHERDPACLADAARVGRPPRGRITARQLAAILRRDPRRLGIGRRRGRWSSWPTTARATSAA